MAREGEAPAKVGSNGVGAASPLKHIKSWPWLLILLRVAAFCATLSATIVMATNRETASVVVATVGTTPIKVTVTAKFHHTPANVFFVITNAMASFHSLAMLGLQVFGKNLPYFGDFRLVTIAVLDMLTVGLAAAGASAAGFMAELGKYGNSHARWDKVCDKFQTFCDHASGALIASFIGVALLIFSNVASIASLHKQKPTNGPLVP